MQSNGTCAATLKTNDASWRTTKLNLIVFLKVFLLNSFQKEVSFFVFDVSLFLGMPLNEFYIKSLDQLDIEIKKIFISDQKHPYLQQIKIENTHYIGKFLGALSSVAEIELLEKNIYSILKKMIPNHSHEEIPLVLLAVPSSCEIPLK
jgi:hypothetical protein